MKTLLVLLAAMLSLGSYFSGGKPARDPEIDAARPTCLDPACRNHAPYLKPWTPGCDWPQSTSGFDPNCKVRRIRKS